MSLLNYHACQVALELCGDDLTKLSKTKGNIEAIGQLLEPYVDDRKLVLVPRFNGGYISFRYCGLEVLRLSLKGQYETCIELTDGRIRGIKRPKEVTVLGDLKPLLDKIKEFLDAYVHDFPTAAKTRRQDKTVPGFFLEHWLESMILADTAIGKTARDHLGLNQDLQRVVSQAPVILNPMAGKRMARHRHIDLLSVNSDGRIIVVELKKDNDLDTAIKELEVYTSWLLRDGKGGDFHPVRGNPLAMVREHYLPDVPNAYSDLLAKDIEAVAVVVTPRHSAPAQLSNGVKLRVVELPKDWLSRDGSIFFE